MYRFYRTYVALLLPMYGVSLYIKTQAAILFDAHSSLQLDLVYLPIEAYFYFMGLLLMAVYLYEFFKSSVLKTNG